MKRRSFDPRDRRLIPAFGMLSIAFIVVLSSAGSALANKHADQYFTAAASEKYGVRGYFRTVTAAVISYHENFTSSVAWIMDEPDDAAPMVEVGFIRGCNAYQDVSSPQFYIAYIDSDDWANDFHIWVDAGDTHDLGASGSLHKYAVSRTAHNNDTGQTKWVWYYDGDEAATLWLNAPDQGHPQAGGETYQSSGTWPTMNAKGRNNGTSGDSDYWCFKNSANDWYRWNPSYAANTSTRDDDGPGGVSITQYSPLYSSFDAVGD